jgi:hypothetical protein
MPEPPSRLAVKRVPKKAMTRESESEPILDGRKVALGFLLASVVPFIVQACFMALLWKRTFSWGLQSPDDINVAMFYTSVATMVISPAIGFVFIWRAYRPSAVFIGVIYFPIMLALMYLFSISVVAELSGVWP